MYEDDAFLDSLASFISEGIHTSESTIVIATSAHLHGLETRLLLKGINPDAAYASGLYIPLLVNEALAKFMVYGLPDETIFTQLITGLIELAKGHRLRIFGELVAFLSGQGFKSATVKLKELCESFSHDKAFCFFCEYPNFGFTQDVKISIEEFSRKYSSVILDWNKLELEAHSLH